MSRELQPALALDIQVDAEFVSLIPPLSERERNLLETSLMQEGLREALLVWKETRILLDGHNRFNLCRKHAIEVRVKYLSFPSREAAKDFVLRTQLARRNLSREAESYLRGKQYLEMRHQGFRSDLTCGPTDRKSVAERLAKEFRVGEKTIRRDAKFALAVEALAGTCGVAAKNLILSREAGLGRQQTIQLAKRTAAEQREFLKRLERGAKRPRQRRAAQRTTITLPANPRALAAALLDRLGPEETARLAKMLAQMLKKQADSK